MKAITLATSLLAITGTATCQYSQRPASPFSGRAASATPKMTAHWPAVNALWESATGVTFAHSEDAGISWTSINGLPVFQAGGDGTFGIAQDGDNVIIAYHTQSNLVMTHTSLDSGASWTPPLDQSGTQVNDNMTGSDVRCMAVGGKFFVTWRLGQQLFLDEAAYSTTPTWSTDEQFASGGTYSYRVAATDQRIGAFFRAADTKLRYKHRDFSAGPWSASLVIDDPIVVTNQLDIAATKTGTDTRFHLVWTQSNNELIRYGVTDTDWDFTVDQGNPTTITSGDNGASPLWRSLRLAIGDNSSVHVFFSSNQGLASTRLGHKMVWPSPGTSLHWLNGSITRRESTIPIPIATEGVLGCFWSEGLTLNPNSSATDPLFNISTDGGSTWLTEPRRLSASFGTSADASVAAVASGYSVCALYSDAPHDDEIGQMVLGYSPLPQLGTQDPDAPILVPAGLPVQSGSVNHKARFSLDFVPCSGATFTFGVVFASFNAPVYAPLGACNLLIDATAGEFILFLYVPFVPGAVFETQLDAGTGLNGAQINVQAALIGSLCGTNCLGTSVSLGQAADFMVFEL